MKTKFIDDRIEYKEDDVGKIQLKPHMYISYTGTKGVIQLFKEVVNNAIDECINPNSIGNKVTVTIDRHNNKITVIDNGRGIPEPETNMKLSCTTIQSSSKFTREQSGNTAGENGVGLTCVNALSSEFRMIVNRFGKQYELLCINGKSNDIIIKDSDQSITGTCVSFVPSTLYMGNYNIDEIIDETTQWLNNIAYILPNKMTIIFQIIDDTVTLIDRKFRNTGGMVGLLNSSKYVFDTDLVSLYGTTTISEKIRDFSKDKIRHVDRNVSLEIVFGYSSKIDEFESKSFCNFIDTVDGGTHVDGVKTGIGQILLEQCKLSKGRGNDPIIADVYNGMVLVVNMLTDLSPHFASQTKEKISSPEFLKICKTLAIELLLTKLKDDPTIFNRVFAFIRMNTKARTEADRAKRSVIRGEIDSLYEHKIQMFVPANNTKTKQYRELYIVEGESALGSCKAGRFDNDTQAIFGVKGVPKNSFGISLDKVLANDQFADLIRILKTNSGPKFNISKLFYDKIIIMTDADIDGQRILSTLCTFFIRHMPEIVLGGYVYRALPPLYALNNKDKKFVLDKQEYISIFNDRIKLKIQLRDKSGKVLSKSDMDTFLSINRNYLSTLSDISKYSRTHTDILEAIAMLITEFGDNWITQFNTMSDAFSGVSITEKGILKGTYDNGYQICRIDDLFYDRIQPLVNIYKENGVLEYEMYEKSGSKWEYIGTFNIGTIVKKMEKYRPAIITRFKGLGELNPVDLKHTSMDPSQRILLRLTIKDMQDTINQFAILHGPNREARKLMMKNYTIDPDDIDN